MIFLICATAYSIFQVPYVALPAELTADYAERTRLLTWRVAILAVAILGWLAGRVGKKQGNLISSLMLAAGALGLSVAGQVPVLIVFMLTAVTGIGYAGCQLFPLAMLPDTAAHDAHRTGKSRAGLFTGVWTAGETLGLALGPAIYALVLALGDYRSSSDGSVEQPASAVLAITWGFSAGTSPVDLDQSVVDSRLHAHSRGCRR